ncbi:MAG: ankyrin repeat domain-containing protein [Candidatus Micrarchaeota archaeon]
MQKMGVDLMKEIDARLLECAKRGDVYLKEIEELLEKKANPEVKDEHGWTPLMLSAFNGHVEIVKLLIRKGVNLEARNDNLETAVMLAGLMGELKVVEFLDGKGANLEAVDKDGKSVLETARRGRRVWHTRDIEGTVAYIERALKEKTAKLTRMKRRNEGKAKSDVNANGGYRGAGRIAAVGRN